MTQVSKSLVYWLWADDQMAYYLLLAWPIGNILKFLENFNEQK